MELAGLEPATSWVRCIARAEWGAPPGSEWPVFTGDLASAPTGASASCGYACTRLVPAPRVQPPRPPTHSSCPRAATVPDQRIFFFFSSDSRYRDYSRGRRRWNRQSSPRIVTSVACHAAGRGPRPRSRRNPPCTPSLRLPPATLCVRLLRRTHRPRPPRLPAAPPAHLRTDTRRSARDPGLLLTNARWSSPIAPALASRRSRSGTKHSSGRADARDPVVADPIASSTAPGCRKRPHRRWTLAARGTFPRRRRACAGMNAGALSCWFVLSGAFNPFRLNLPRLRT